MDKDYVCPFRTNTKGLSNASNSFYKSEPINEDRLKEINHTIEQIINGNFNNITA